MDDSWDLIADPSPDSDSSLLPKLAEPPANKKILKQSTTHYYCF